MITKEYLTSLGWAEKSGVMVRFSNPRIGWKPDGTLIIGWWEWDEKITKVEQLNEIPQMLTKIFTTIEQKCPFGKEYQIDSTKCRSCEFYFRMGTGMFFWCKHPIPEPKPKRGRPKKVR